MNNYKEYIDKDEIINIIGQREKSLFWEPVLTVINYKKIQDDIQKNLNDYLTKYEVY